MKLFKKLYYKIFPHYRRLELQCAPYVEADRLIKENANKLESERWDIAPEEDSNVLGAMTRMVWIERKERIMQ